MYDWGVYCAEGLGFDFEESRASANEFVRVHNSEGGHCEGVAYLARRACGSTVIQVSVDYPTAVAGETMPMWLFAESTRKQDQPHVD
jgi:hypothetical protein